MWNVIIAAATQLVGSKHASIGNLVSAAVLLFLGVTMTSVPFLPEYKLVWATDFKPVLQRLAAQEKQTLLLKEDQIYRGLWAAEERLEKKPKDEFAKKRKRELELQLLRLRAEMEK